MSLISCKIAGNLFCASSTLFGVKELSDGGVFVGADVRAGFNSAPRLTLNMNRTRKGIILAKVLFKVIYIDFKGGNLVCYNS